MKHLILLSLVTFVSCSVSKTKLSDEAKDIKVVYTKPTKGCNAVKKVVGENDEGVLDLAVNHARNLAAREDATTLFIEDKVNVSQKWRVYATAYICSKK